VGNRSVNCTGRGGAFRMDEKRCRTIHREVLIAFVCRLPHRCGCTALAGSGTALPPLRAYQTAAFPLFLRAERCHILCGFVLLHVSIGKTRR